ncbi:MAG: hypothetical protein N4A76_03940 [Firmicutes bacterium]|jgi:hypothetical protein|nr:hypothetical protein [Bacillota bacterium]
MINKIEIKEIKGIEKQEYNFNIVPNKPNMFVAPNGFGKSSFATAFGSLKRKGISLEENDMFNHSIDSNPSISISMSNGGVFKATKEKNEISKEFDIWIINSQLYPKASTKNFGSFSSTKADICVKPITIYKTVPKKIDIDYSFKRMKLNYGNLGKLLSNVSTNFKDTNFITKLSVIEPDIKKLWQVSKMKKIDEFIIKYSGIKGTSNNILNQTFDYSSLESIDEYMTVLEFVKNVFNNEEVTIREHLDCIQIIKTLEFNKKNLNKIFKYYSFRQMRNELDEQIKVMNTTWKNIKSKQTNNTLVLEMPPASHISNGERDIICFVAKLYEVKAKITSKRTLLIIDEIFDYLDDGNLITAQYFVNQIIEESKKEGRKFYPIILTHLDPQYFRTYSFNIKNVNYLDGDKKNVDKFNFHKVLKNRNAIDTLAKYYLHYHPDNFTENALMSFDVKDGIEDKFKFYEVAANEVKNLVNGKNYDIAMVCSGLRHHIEMNVYKLLDNQYKEEFITMHGTNNKLDFASERGIIIPEVYYMLGIIYNEVLHLDQQSKKLISVGQKLRNRTVIKMIDDVISNTVEPSICIS